MRLTATIIFETVVSEKLPVEVFIRDEHSEKPFAGMFNRDVGLEFDKIARFIAEYDVVEVNYKM